MRKPNWIDLNKEKPPKNELVELKFDYLLIASTCDNKPIPQRWRSKGRMTHTGNFSIKYTKGLSFENSKPTHWRKII